MADKTHWKKCVSDSAYIGEADFQPGEEKIVTIAKVVSSEKVQTAEGSSEKAVVHFEGGVKPMILNVAKSKAITKVVGSPFFEDWPGHSIQLYVEPNIRAFGEVVNAVRVRPRKPVIKQAVKCADCGEGVRDAAGKGADYIVQGTKKTYGAALCWNCASKRAAKVKEAAPDESAGAD